MWAGQAHTLPLSAFNAFLSSQAAALRLVLPELITEGPTRASTGHFGAALSRQARRQVCRPSLSRPSGSQSLRSRRPQIGKGLQCLGLLLVKRVSVAVHDQRDRRVPVQLLRHLRVAPPRARLLMNVCHREWKGASREVRTAVRHRESGCASRSYSGRVLHGTGVASPRYD